MKNAQLSNAQLQKPTFIGLWYKRIADEKCTICPNKPRQDILFYTEHRKEVPEIRWQWIADEFLALQNFAFG
ncbi:MAG: hypothetical protein IPP17_29600 [Bacteroidetes bacterium]|nr:hypothetical protein [Bacteroidota bacterium]